MTNKELKASVKKKTGLSSKTVDGLMKAFVNTMNDTLNGGCSVNFKGFGIFELAERQERKVFNPMTKKYKVIPKKKTAKFKPSSVLKNTLKG